MSGSDATCYVLTDDAWYSKVGVSTAHLYHVTVTLTVILPMLTFSFFRRTHSKDRPARVNVEPATIHRTRPSHNPGTTLAIPFTLPTRPLTPVANPRRITIRPPSLNRLWSSRAHYPHPTLHPVTSLERPPLCLYQHRINPDHNHHSDTARLPRLFLFQFHAGLRPRPSTTSNIVRIQDILSPWLH